MVPLEQISNPELLLSPTGPKPAEALVRRNGSLRDRASETASE
jgi:hypothetical protein